MTQAIFQTSLDTMKVIRFFLSFLWACLCGAIVAGFIIAGLMGLQTLNELLNNS